MKVFQCPGAALGLALLNCIFGTSGTALVIGLTHPLQAPHPNPTPVSNSLVTLVQTVK